MTDTTTSSSALAAKVAAAIRSIELGNNGYADIGTDPELAVAVEAAGYAVIRARDLWGRWVYRGYTPAANALRCSALYRAECANTVSPAFSLPLDDAGYDIEGAILARQEALGYYD